MGKPTGFVEWPRHPADRRAVAERLADFREVEPGGAGAELTRQAGRCMDCGVPFCMQGCPLGNPIPDFNDRVYRGRWQDAWKRLSATNNFPEFTGRLCPAPCEAACVLEIREGDAVTIKQIENSIIDHAWDAGWVVPRPPARETGRSAAVIGAGPAGSR